MSNQFAKLGDIKFGKLDAYTEYIEYGSEMYKSLFLACPNFHVDRFLSGQLYYIHGEKGTGKTALLKYVEVMATENGSWIEYIRFKKDVDEDDRNRIKRAGVPMHPFEEIIESEIPTDGTINCVLAWQVYIIKCILLRVASEEKGVFVRDDRWKKILALIKCAYPAETINYKKIIPNLKKGALKLDTTSIKLDIDFEWDNKSEKLINFSTFARYLISAYKDLKPDEKSCFILFDELELVYLQKKKYERDVSLIRDLIIAVNYMNEISKTSSFPVHIIACIRNEVYRSIAAIGTELNKPIQDYGVEVSWTQHGGDIADNPLIQMISNRLLQSQSAEVKENYSSVWNEYISEDITINGKRAMNYIIDQTWNRPRDITRLFTLIQKRAENKSRIDVSDFEAVRAKYAEEAWQEFSNELSAKYCREEIDGIKQVLTGITIPFSAKEFLERLKEESELFENVKILYDKRRVADILSDLYRIGVIGNGDDFSRFAFKGNEAFDPLSNCTIHYPLRRFFTAKNRPALKTR